MIIFSKNELVLAVSTMGIAALQWALPGCVLGVLIGVIVVLICDYKPTEPYGKIKRGSFLDHIVPLFLHFLGGK